MNEIIYQATIPLDPRTKKNHSRIFEKKTYKNGKVIKTPFIAPSAEYKEYEQQALWFLQAKQIDYPVNIKFTFYMKTRRRVDMVNLIESILDILVKKRTITDDCRDIVYSMDGSRVFYDKDNPRTEIIITKAEGVQLWAKK